MSKDPSKELTDYVEEYGVYKKSTKESVAEYVEKENHRQRREGLIGDEKQDVINLKAVPAPALKTWHKVLLGVGVVIVIVAVAFCIKLAN